VGGIDFAVRSRSPSTVVVDGKLNEWVPISDTAGLPRVIVTLEPSRWWLTIEIGADASAHLTFQLSLPGGELPSCDVYGTAGVDELDCERIGVPNQSKGRISECRRRFAIAKRCAALASANLPRFKTWIDLNGEQLSFSEGRTPKPAQPLQQACTRDEKRLSCEFELPLLLLPRTAAVELTQVGFLPSPTADARQDEVWINLPESIAFESGLWVHQNAMFPPASDTSPRFSYQPGAGVEYEIASRDDSETNGMSNVSISSCGPGRVLAKLGTLTLLGNCAPAHMTFIYRNGEPIGTAIDGTVVVRDNMIVVLSRREYFDYIHLYPAAAWGVERIDSDGTKLEPLEVSTDGSMCEASKTSANADYSKLSLSCTTSVDGVGRRVLNRTWRWDVTARNFVEQ
jgi:hypothetical protein